MYYFIQSKKTLYMFSLSAILFFLILSKSTLFAQESEEDKTLAPFFYVQCEDTLINQLPLKATSAKVSISGIIADVTITQTYINEGFKTLEAVYIFPASTKAAIYAMKMKIGDREIMAEIKEKNIARQEYEEAKEEGRTASLLEQQRPNVFQMNVANIIPGDTIEIEMKYTETIVPTAGVYEFVYPTVVGPRYISPSNSDEDDEWAAASANQHAGGNSSFPFQIDININGGMAVFDLECPSHDSSVSTTISSNSAIISMYDATGAEANRDFIVRYRLANDDISTGLLMYKGENENFFLAMIQPPKLPNSNYIPPREYVFIMDVSGSMTGFPIEISKTLLKNLIGNLNSIDKFNVVLFANSSKVLSDTSINANLTNINKAIDLIDNQSGGGGTELLTALNTALNLQGTENYSRSFIIATDGYVVVEKEAFDLIRENLDNANFFSFGIGTGVNRYIIEGMAHVGMGESFVILNEEEAPEIADKFRNYIQNPVLTNIEVDFSDFELYDVEPVTIPDVFAERPILIFGKYKGTPSGTIQVRGLSGNRNFYQEIDISNYTPMSSNSALQYLWARHKIQILSDYVNIEYATDSTLIKKITQLGLDYSLITQYTSFIAADSIIRNEVNPNEGYNSKIVVNNAAAGGIAEEWAVVGVDMHYNSSGNFSIIQAAYPNPFTKSSTIQIYIEQHECEFEKSIQIYNCFGQMVDIIDISDLKEGQHNVIIDFENKKYNTGIYYIRLNIANTPVSSFKILYMKE